MAMRRIRNRSVFRRPWSRRERTTLAQALLALAILAPSFARAEVSFSTAERAVIARNASLRASLARDPALVRQVLDRMGAPSPRLLDPGTAGSGTRDMPLPMENGSGFDPAADPDLGALQRASPEAAHDLFQLLTQASSGAKQKSGE